MRFYTAAIVSFLALATTIAAAPGDSATLAERATKKKCCACYSPCVNDCENGFEENPVGEGLCILSCKNSCGCTDKMTSHCG